MEHTVGERPATVERNISRLTIARVFLGESEEDGFGVNGGITLKMAADSIWIVFFAK
jgi:hypothetical protein